MNKKIYYKPSVSTGFIAAFSLLKKMKGDVNFMMVNSDSENRKLRHELIIAVDSLAAFMYDEFLKKCFGVV